MTPNARGERIAPSDEPPHRWRVFGGTNMRDPQDIPFGDGTFADALRLHKAGQDGEEGE